jgi:LysM repeat protein
MSIKIACSSRRIPHLTVGLKVPFRGFRGECFCCSVSHFHTKTSRVKRFISIVAVVLLGGSGLFAQYLNKQSLVYIEQFKDLAMDHQRRFKIPSSITLAQGLLESGSGKSRLTQESNNHFGIKCHNGWTGPRVYHDDDIKDDCFRKYEKADDSYEDHSQFLSTKPRYQSLFDLNIRDYRGWATGLQSAGYATDKSYANKLIKTIEDYGLYQYDVLAMGKRDATRTDKTEKKEKRVKQKAKLRDVFLSNDLLYVVAKRGDTFESLATELDFDLDDLLKYNEVPEDFPLSQGDIVYLQKKNKKVKGNYEYHIVKPGESMHSISQTYGIRMKYLYKINKLDGEYMPNDGDTLKLK